jgi:diguanylate cyclase (GGDEF)-like protein
VRRLLGLYQRIEQAQRAEREQAQQQLRFWQDEALRDPLCGVLNRRGLQMAARGLLQPGRLVAVLLLDLDHFKSINDRFGHALGDQVLVQAAQLMQSAIREGDLLARLGGEEFCVLLPGCGPEPAQRLADKLRTRIAEADWSLLDPALGLSVSGGIATGQGEASLDELIAVADQRLYEAKAEGRNRIRA